MTKNNNILDSTSKFGEVIKDLINYLEENKVVIEVWNGKLYITHHKEHAYWVDAIGNDQNTELPSYPFPGVAILDNQDGENNE